MEKPVLNSAIQITKVDDFTKEILNERKKPNKLLVKATIEKNQNKTRDFMVHCLTCGSILKD